MGDGGIGDIMGMGLDGHGTSGGISGMLPLGCLPESVPISLAIPTPLEGKSLQGGPHGITAPMLFLASNSMDAGNHS